MKPVFGEDAFDAAGADHPSGLSQLLGDHLWGSVAVEEAVPDDLPDHLGRSPIVRFRTAFLASQSQRTRFVQDGAELKVTLLAVTEFARRLERSTFFALPFDEHQQLERDLVVLTDVQDPPGSDQRVVLRIELCHVCFLPKGSRLLGLPRHEDSRGNDSRNDAISLINYGGFVGCRYRQLLGKCKLFPPGRLRIPPYLNRLTERGPATRHDTDEGPR